MHRVSIILDRKRNPSAPAPTVFYKLVKDGRIELFHVGRASYVRETWAEIVERISAEDHKAGVKGKGRRPMPSAIKEQLTAIKRGAV